MKERVKRHVLFSLAALISMGVLLYVSTDIVLYCSGLGIEELPAVEGEWNEQVFFDVFYITVKGGLSDTVDLTGYAYMETDEPNPDKKIDLMWVSDDHIYKIGTNISDHYGLRADLVQRNIQGTHHMFSSVFSHAQMEDGMYTLFIYCYENEGTSSYTCTPYPFKKKGRSFIPLSGYVGTQQGQQSILNASTDEPVYHSIEVCKKAEDLLQIRGWAAAIGYPSEESDILLALTDENGETVLYDTLQFLRHYLRTPLQDTIYDHSAFYTNIPLSDLEEGTYTLSILVQAGTLRLAPLSHKVIYGADGSITFERGTLPASTPKKTYAERQDIPLADFTQNRELYHSIGSCNPVDDVLQVKGWGIEVGTPSAEAEVFIGLTNSSGEGAVYNTEAYAGTYLRDVLENGQIYDNSYFECNIPLSELEPGSYVLEVLVRGRESGRSIVPHALLVKEDGTIEYTP